MASLIKSLVVVFFSLFLGSLGSLLEMGMKERGSLRMCRRAFHSLVVLFEFGL